MKLDPPGNRFRAWCFRQAVSDDVEKWVMVAIFANVAIMALRHFVRCMHRALCPPPSPCAVPDAIVGAWMAQGMSDGLSNFIEVANVAFGFLFLVEIVIRVSASTVRHCNAHPMPLRLTALYCAPLFLLDQALGLGFRQFFSSSMWNPFDLTIVVVNTTLMVRYHQSTQQHTGTHTHARTDMCCCDLTVMRWVCGRSPNGLLARRSWTSAS